MKIASSTAVFGSLATALTELKQAGICLLEVYELLVCERR